MELVGKKYNSNFINTIKLVIELLILFINT